ncbi:MAG: hypothetical protein JXA20_16860 [Spirochaetes bacterium]|nr:hypothetical protein [Spirochaetota bacterium]
MKRSVRIPAAALWVLFATAACDADAAGYSAEVVVFTHGTHRLMTMTLSETKVRVVAHSLNAGPDCVIADRPLTEKERSTLGRFFGEFPLDDLKDRYENTKVEGEIHRTFSVCVKGRCKEVRTYFKEVPPLEELVGQFNRLVPDASGARCP